MKNASLLAAVLTLPVLASATLRAENAPEFRVETKEHKDARMAWFREARYGMFIHWGVYAVLAGYYQDKPVGRYGEQIMLHGKIPIADYKKFAPKFNPVKFNADEWVKAAKDGGMKYLVITAKHHDGFAMFKTEADSFNIMDATPFKRDVIKELAAACRRQGIKFGVYYSQNLDWLHPGGGGRTADPAHIGDSGKYVDEIVIPQVRELLSNYGEISVLWWDIPGGVITPARAERICKMAGELQPNIIMNNRLGGGFKGDTETPEQSIPAQGFPGRDWETCMTINNTWGYKRDDRNFKPTAMLLRNLIDIASKGGNYLLNVGPDGEGVIPAEELQRISEIGKWLQTNGESIYGTGPTVFGEECGVYSETDKDKSGKPVFKRAWDWRCTVKPGKVFIHLLKWPNGEFSFEPKGRIGAVRKAYLLADPQKTSLKVTQSGSKWSVFLPAAAPDPLVSVLVLETAAK